MNANTDWLQDPFAAAYPESAPFWQAAASQKLVLPRCVACERVHWYPRVVCPHCGGTDLAWTESAGRGTIYAFSPARRADPAYTLAYVRLDEGSTLLTNIVDAAPESLAIGQVVSVRFSAAPEGRMMPFFAPA